MNSMRAIGSMPRVRRTLIAAILMAAACASLRAQTASSTAGGGVPQAPIEMMSTQDMVRQLNPSGTRSLRNLAPRLDLSIQFDFDSAQIRPQSHELLLNLARALQNDALKDLRVRVEGHTDSTGSQAHNIALSRRRAQSVAEYLSQAGVESQRLEAVGMGYSDLLLPHDPKSAANRRARVVPIRP